MSHIVAGWFSTQERAQHAMAALEHAGFAEGEYDSFYIAPPGQHGDLPLHDETHHDEGASESGEGALKGAALGGAAGLAAGALAAVVSAPLGPAAVVAAAGVGAYVGSLAGAVNKSRDGNLDEADIEEPVERPAGAIVSICTDRVGAAPAIAILRAQGAEGIEMAEGEWDEGQWKDFDPLIPPRLLSGEKLPTPGSSN